MRATKTAVVAGALALLAGAASGAQIIRQQYVEARAVVEHEPMARGATVRAAVQIQIGDGYHVNANPPSEDWLIPTEVSVCGAPGVEVLEVFYPDADEKLFVFWSAPLRVYEGAVVAGVLLRVAEDAELGPHDLQFKVDYQACNNEACFAPNAATTSVPLSVGPAGAASRTLRSPLLERARFDGEPG